MVRVSGKSHVRVWAARDVWRCTHITNRVGKGVVFGAAGAVSQHMSALLDLYEQSPELRPELCFVNSDALYPSRQGPFSGLREGVLQQAEAEAAFRRASIAVITARRASDFTR